MNKFDPRALGNKNSKNFGSELYYDERNLLASGLVTVFLQEKPSSLFDGIHLILQNKKNGKEFGKLGEENVAIINNLLEHKRVTSSHNKKNYPILFK